MRPIVRVRISLNNTLRAVALLAGLLHGARGQTNASGVKSEFGIVIAHSEASVQLQVYNAKSGEVEIHRYMRKAEAGSDLLHAGDQVQVLFVWNGPTRVLRRAAILSAPLGANTKGPLSKQTGTKASRTNVAPDLSSKSKGVAVQQAMHQANLTVGAVPNAGKTIPAQVELGVKVQAKVSAVTVVPLGIDRGYAAKATAPVSRSVALETPTPACHVSDRDWPGAPLRIVVLDFRYPTEREDAHDLGTASGGSGMAVADLVYARLKQWPEFAVDRGDRRRLDRADIAGAARLGRELGADAVLEGTFFPVEKTAGPDSGVVTLKGYELHAGVVDTCTGQVLMKLRSPSVLSLEVAQDPATHAVAAVDGLLAELEGPAAVSSAGSEGTGAVAGIWNGTVTVRMTAGTALKQGDRLSVRATRLAKNPTTYTLVYERAGEIGRIVVRHVDGAMATGRFEGDIPPKVGDGVEIVRE